ncbi:MAG: hypothetical protein IPJ81_10640 [Chitinophagaceae bacterium]|nr:hypothetical protein [Chitinophagaceae bacterium]
MHKINIPKPCHEKWSEMIPQGQGAFCGQCSKVVVDFTKMSDDEVQNYFIQHAHEKLCGRFNQQQVDNIKIEIPSYLIYKQPSFLKKFILISLVVFGTTLYSCTNSNGTVTGTEFVINATDTVPKRTHTIGIIAAPIDTTKKTCNNPEIEIMGDIAMLPTDTAETIVGNVDIKNDTVKVSVGSTGRGQFVAPSPGKAAKKDNKKSPSTENYTMGAPALAPQNPAK